MEQTDFDGVVMAFATLALAAGVFGWMFWMYWRHTRALEKLARAVERLADRSTSMG